MKYEVKIFPATCSEADIQKWINNKAEHGWTLLSACSCGYGVMLNVMLIMSK